MDRAGNENKSGLPKDTCSDIGADKYKLSFVSKETNKQNHSTFKNRLMNPLLISHLVLSK